MTSESLRKRLIDNYCTAELPEYFIFVGLDNENYISLSYEYSNFIWTEPVEYFIPKGSSGGYRRYALINPFIYLQIVNLLCDNDVFQFIQLHNAKPKTIKSFTELPRKNKHDAINQWLTYSEEIPPSLVGEYSHMLKLDVSRFYESIYTHSISWALHTKKIAKLRKNDKSLVGNRIDNGVSSMNFGQTNGLLVGNGVSDFVSEIIMREVDYMLELKLNGMKYEGLRFRDDYLFFTKSITGAQRIKKELDLILQREFNLSINHEKTSISADPLSDYYPNWKDDARKSGAIQKLYIYGEISIKNLNTILREIYLIQKNTTKSTTTLLIELGKKRISLDNAKESQILTSISYLIGIARIKEDVTPHVMALISEKIIDNISEGDLVLKIYKTLITKFNPESASEFQLLWLHRLILGLSNKLDGVGFDAGAEGKVLNIAMHGDEKGFFEYPDEKRLNDLHLKKLYDLVHQNFSIINRELVKDISSHGIGIKQDRLSLKYGGF